VGSIPGGSGALHLHFHTGSGAYSASCPVDTGGKVTMADIDHSSTAVPTLGKMSCRKSDICNRPH